MREFAGGNQRGADAFQKYISKKTLYCRSWSTPDKFVDVFIRMSVPELKCLPVSLEQSAVRSLWMPAAHGGEIAIISNRWNTPAGSITANRKKKMWIWIQAIRIFSGCHPECVLSIPTWRKRVSYSPTKEIHPPSEWDTTIGISESWQHVQKSEKCFCLQNWLSSRIKGKRIGDAQISEKHANFIINLGNAKAGDIVRLIDLVKRTVYQNSGLMLEAEVKMVGFSHSAQEAAWASQTETYSVLFLVAFVVCLLSVLMPWKRV